MERATTLKCSHVSTGGDRSCAKRSPTLDPSFGPSQVRILEILTQDELATIGHNARPALFLDVSPRRMALILTASTDNVLVIVLVSDPTPRALFDCSMPAPPLNLTTV